MILDDIAFRGLLGKGEKIYYVAHVHPFTIYPELLKILVFGISLPVGGYFLMPPFIWIWIGWAVLGIILFAYQIVKWYLDAWLITSYGVIDQEWNTIFDKQTTRIEYANIEGVTTEIKGFWNTILRYGSLKLEHMSGTTIEIKNVASPKKVERYIVRYQQEFSRQQNFTDHGKLKDLLTTMIRSNINK